jgi:hypothetical protein
MEHWIAEPNQTSFAPRGDPGCVIPHPHQRLCSDILDSMLDGRTPDEVYSEHDAPSLGHGPEMAPEKLAV